jgi:DNA-binding transcriptional MerR regulator
MKKQLYVKEFAGLTKVTVRTLHYYDQIGLLHASGRTDSGYRLYTENDLLKLQQIMTLKFIGFSLMQIKNILARPQYAVQKSLQIQIQAVEEEIARLRKASKALRQAVQVLDAEGRIHWKKILKIMEVIQMSEEIKKNWARKFFTEAELKEFEEIGKKYTPAQMQDYQNKWTELIAEVQKNIHADPSSEVAQSLADRWKVLLDQGYGGHPQLLQKIGQANRASFKTNEWPTPDGKAPFSPEIWDFIQKAVEARKQKESAR